jgi:hypothetical protein
MENLGRQARGSANESDLEESFFFDSSDRPSNVQSEHNGLSETSMLVPFINNISSLKLLVIKLIHGEKIDSLTEMMKF